MVQSRGHREIRVFLAPAFPHTPRPTATTLGSAWSRPTHRCRNGANQWRLRAAAPPKPPQIDTRHAETAPAPCTLHCTPNGACRVMHNSLPFPEMVFAWIMVAGVRGAHPLVLHPCTSARTHSSAPLHLAGTSEMLRSQNLRIGGEGSGRLESPKVAHVIF